MRKAKSEKVIENPQTLSYICWAIAKLRIEDTEFLDYVKEKMLSVRIRKIWE